MAQVEAPVSEMVRDIIPHIRAAHTQKQFAADNSSTNDAAAAQRLLMLDVLFLRLARLEEAVNRKDHLNNLILRRSALHKEAMRLYEEVKAL